MFFRILLFGSVATHLFISSSAKAQREPIVPRTLQVGLLARFDESTSKGLQLGEAIPAEKYSWRPAPGVRSIGEVLIHIDLGTITRLRTLARSPPSRSVTRPRGRLRERPTYSPFCEPQSATCIQLLIDSRRSSSSTQLRCSDSLRTTKTCISLASLTCMSTWDS